VRNDLRLLRTMRGLAQAELAAATGVSRQTINCGVLLASRRSETVEGLLDRRDERISEIDLKDTDFTGGVLVTASSSPSSWVGIQPSGTTRLGRLVRRKPCTASTSADLSKERSTSPQSTSFPRAAHPNASPAAVNLHLAGGLCR
jgi:Helix-turn-helix